MSRPPIIGHHLILTGYGHWLPNDPRGSGSSEIKQSKFEDLGPIHFGRKQVQPSRDELRMFQNEAQPRLEHEVIWFDQSMRDLLADAVANVVECRKYTVWAMAILKNHLHLCIRKHRDDALTMLDLIGLATCERLRKEGVIPGDHPLWANRPYKRYLYTPQEVRNVVHYIEDNPEREGVTGHGVGRRDGAVCWARWAAMAAVR